MQTDALESLRDETAFKVRLERRRRHGQAMAGPTVGSDWREWFRTNLPGYVASEFAPRHERMWEWLTALVPGVVPQPFVAIWPRGGAKSSSAELGCAWVQQRRTRKYVLYICGVQDQADKHVGAVAGVLETLRVNRAQTPFSNSRPSLPVSDLFYPTKNFRVRECPSRYA